MEEPTMSATAEKKQVLFRSLDPTLRLVRVPERRRENSRGELEVIPGERYEFNDGVFTVDADDKDTLDYLRGHHRFNSKFYEVGNEPDRQRPSIEEAMEEIADATVASDMLKLTEIYDREHNTYARPAVLRGCQRAMERLEQRGIAEGASGQDE
jgi:hypothetical protein